MSRAINISPAPTELGRSAIWRFCLAAALIAVMPGSPAAGEKLVLQLHREAQFEFAGYYAALWQGFYRDAGLDVDILPGSPPDGQQGAGSSPTDPVREVAEGRARFGTGTAQLLVRAAQGLPLLMLTPIFQQSGTAVYYRADSDFSSPAALLAGRIARLPASNILDLELRTALKSEAIDPDRLRSLSIQPDQGLAELADRRVDAVVGAAWELPWQAREKGVLLKSFNPAAYRVEFYGDCLFTLQRLAKADPASVQRFREASLKGWDYALQHSGEIAARILAELPVQVPVSDPAGFARYQSEVARRLARYPEIPLGHSNRERWSRMQQSLIEIGAISRPVALDAFLYDRDPEARTGDKDDTRNALILGIAGLGVVAVIAGLLWRWWLRRNLVLAYAAFKSPEISPAAADGRGRPGRRPATRAERRRELAGRIVELHGRMRQYPFHWLRSARSRAAASRALGRLFRSVRRRAGSIGAVPRPRPTDLNVTLQGLERAIRRRLPGMVNFRLSLSPEPWLCDADHDVVATAAFALVAAAVADMPAGGDLIVGTRQYTIDSPTLGEAPQSAPGDYVRLTVKDNGPGLSAKRLEQIFDPASTARPPVVAAVEAARRLGGFARVESAEGIGTAVHLYFRRTIIAGVEGAERPLEKDVRIRAAE